MCVCEQHNINQVVTVINKENPGNDFQAMVKMIVLVFLTCIFKNIIFICNDWYLSDICSLH